MQLKTKFYFSKLYLLIVIVLVAFSTDSFAQKYSNEFLSIGIGARYQALGNSSVAVIDDVMAGFWNPAGLAWNDDNKKNVSFGFMHSERFAGVGKHDYFGIAIPLQEKGRTIALTLIRQGIDDIPNTLQLYEADGTINYDNISTFSSVDYGFLTSYAQNIYLHSGDLFIGGNLKVVNRKLGPFAKAWGFGIDLGAQFHRKNWSFALMGRDISNTFNAWSFDFTEQEKEALQQTNNAIPVSSLEVTRPQLIFGIAYHKDWEKTGILVETDLTVSFDGKRNTIVSGNPFSVDPSIGAEFHFKKFVFLRAGVNQLQEFTDFDESKAWTIQPSMGLGLKLFKNLKLDYAFTDIGDTSNKTFSHVFSIILDLNSDYFKQVFKKEY